MHTNKRLLDAYNNAKIKYLDSDSRYVFFSDSHRGSDSIADEFTKNKNIFLHALDYYYETGFHLVEAGDGDELMEHSNFKHIRLAHEDVFSSLKRFHDKDRFILIYGNHNIFLRNKDYLEKNYYYYYDDYHVERRELFKDIIAHEALVLKFNNNNTEILVVHGHQGDLVNDQLWMISYLLLRFFWRFMHVIGFKNPSSPAKNQFKRHRIEKKYFDWIKKYKKILICGHTHRPRFSKPGEIPYFNTGSCIRAKGITVIEIINGLIMMVEWGIKTDSDGILRVERDIVRGPEFIENYNFDKYNNLDI
ncbi:MAG TPA: serine/threonine protein phosphatase [Clostridiales bacterium]|nr:serine/threonine protein phosphatase [Clostridiales bacterium]